MKKIILYTLVFASTQFGFTQTKNIKNFNSAIGSIISRLDSTFNRQFGVALVVVRGNDQVFEYYNGYEDFKKKKKVTSDTRFYLSSVTKSFTALSALMLHEKGQLDLDKPLTYYFKNLNLSKVPYADSISIRNLLTHTSGVTNDYLTDRIAYYGNYSDEKLLEILAKYTTANDVGFGKFRYDNLGYNILQLIIKQHLGKEWKEIVAEQVLKPIGMNKTSALISKLIEDNLPIAQPHYQTDMNGSLELLNNTKVDKTLHAAGGHYSTARDLSRWLIIQLNKGSINGKQLFPSNLIALSHQPHASQDISYIDLNRYGYGYGWNLGVDSDNDTIIHHFGGFPGYHSELVLQPQNKIGIAVLVNEGSGIGIVISYLLASYCIDFFLHPEGIDEKYENTIEAYYKMALENFKSIEDERQKRAQRQWMLELPFEMYAGTYTSDELGSIEIEYDNENYKVNHGIITSKSVEPYTKRNTMRVEILDNGVVFHFNIKNGVIESLTREGVVYYKQAR